MARSRLLGALSTAAVAAASTVAPATAAPAVVPEPKVVLFAIDGFDADYLDGRVPLPNIEALARRGGVTTGTGVMSTMTNQSWTSVSTGAYPETTLNAAYYYDEDAGVVRGQTRASAVEGLGEALRRQGRTIASVQWFILQNKGVSYGDPDGLYTQPGGDCTRRGDDAVAILEGRPVDSGGSQVTASGVPDLLAVYCDDLDAVGHPTGDASPEIDQALARVDEQVGRVVEATRRAGTYDQTTFVLLGDHGMTSYDAVNGPQTEAAIDATGYEAQWVSTNRRPAPGTDVVLAGAGLTSVHLVGDAAGDPVALDVVRRAIESVEGIDRVADKAQQAAWRMAPQYGDLVVEPAPGWAMFAADAPFTRGRHGTSQELAVTFLVSGAQIRPGVAPNGPRHVDVAPTVASLLGTEPPAASEGRVLSETFLPGRR